MKTQLTAGRDDSTRQFIHMPDNELHCQESLRALSDAAISAGQHLHISHMTPWCTASLLVGDDQLPSILQIPNAWLDIQPFKMTTAMWLSSLLTWDIFPGGIVLQRTFLMVFKYALDFWKIHLLPPPSLWHTLIRIFSGPGFVNSVMWVKGEYQGVRIYMLPILC